MPAEQHAPVTLLLATRNLHKVAEIRAILPERFLIRSLNDLPAAPAVEEDANTFAGNAAKKALELAKWLASMPVSESGISGSGRALVLADDSGLEVDALAGAPGVYSARFAALDPMTGEASRAENPDAANNSKLLRLMEQIPADKRGARFRCVLALAEVPPRPGSTARFFEGICPGRIGFLPRGEGGFGYDPLFVPGGYQQSFAELGEAIKNQISHRARAVAKLREYLEGR